MTQASPQELLQAVQELQRENGRLVKEYVVRIISELFLKFFWGL